VAGLEVRILGPLEVLRDGVRIDLGAPRQRAVLAMLALRANTVVAADELLDALWGSSVSRGARHNLQVHIASLRSIIERANDRTRPKILVTRSPGYVLHVEADDLDASRFERLVDDGRARAARGDALGAVQVLDDALSLWRGNAMSDIGDADFASRERDRLDELRMAAFEVRFDAALDLGRHAELVGEIERLTRANPLRERLWAQYILALYRAGRQAEALRAYEELRRILRDELGVEPSRELRDLEAAVLAHAVSLDHVAPAPPAAVVPPTLYARSGELSIAYSNFGTGPRDILFVSGFVSNVELLWDVPAYADRIRRLAELGRVVYFDKRGTGCSDRSFGAGSVEDRMHDLLAVADAARIADAVVVGLSEGTALSILFAAAFPERVQSLVLWGSSARILRGPDYDVGVDPDLAEWYVNEVHEQWGTGQVLQGVSQPVDAETLERLARFERQAASPEAAATLTQRNIELDVRYALASVRAPALVVHRTGDPLVPLAHARYVAEHIPNARLAELAGDFHVSSEPDGDRDVFAAIGAFVSGMAARSPVAPNARARALTTVFVAEFGDPPAAEPEVLTSSAVRLVHELTGVVVTSERARVVATFDRPGRAIQCAHALQRAMQAQGVECRVGVHTGEVEQRDGHVTGVGVEMAARICERAGRSEVLVSSTVKDLVIGSEQRFVDRGAHDIDGAPGVWQLWAATRLRPAG
jgi:DNA-binding SARP family transcriptional activator/pimeloyl-ACP methyl ester carboxylesterase